MRLAQLEARFVRYEDNIDTWDVVDGDQTTWRARGCPTHPVTGPRTHIITVKTLAEAQGVDLLCPKCFTKNAGNVGTHWITVTFAGRGALDHQGCHGLDGKPTRWQVSGTSIEDLTTMPSILLSGPGCGWHGFIENGAIVRSNHNS
jgi:hypothetical protein